MNCASVMQSCNDVMYNRLKSHYQRQSVRVPVITLYARNTSRIIVHRPLDPRDTSDADSLELHVRAQSVRRSGIAEELPSEWLHFLFEPNNYVRDLPTLLVTCAYYYSIRLCHIQRVNTFIAQSYLWRDNCLIDGAFTPDG